MFVEKPSEQYAPYNGAGNNKTQTRVERNLRPDVPGIWFLWEHHSHASVTETHGPAFAMSSAIAPDRFSKSAALDRGSKPAKPLPGPTTLDAYQEGLFHRHPCINVRISELKGSDPVRDNQDL
jgi:hypothetical protein